MRLRDNAKSRDNTVLRVVCFNFNESYKSIIWGLPRVYNELRNICGRFGRHKSMMLSQPWLLSLKTWCDPLSLCTWPPGWSVIQRTCNKDSAEACVIYYCKTEPWTFLYWHWFVLQLIFLQTICSKQTSIVFDVSLRVLMWFLKPCALIYFTHCSANSQCIFSMHY